MAKQYDMKFLLGANLGSDFKTAFTNAQKIMQETQRDINALHKAQSDISAYQSQQRAVDDTARKFADLQKEYDNIQREINETEGFSSSLENKLIEKQRAIDKTCDSLKKQTDKLNEMGDALREAGIDTDHLAEESDNLKNKLDDLAEKQRKVKEEAQEYGEKGANAFSAVGDALIAAGLIKGLSELYGWYKSCIDESAKYADAINTEAAQYGIATDKLQGYHYAAELVDVDVDTITSAMTKNVRSMYQAQQGSQDTADAYAELGISIYDTNGHLRDSEDVFWDIIDTLGLMTNESERDAVAMKLLGRNAIELNPLIKAGSQTMKGYVDEAKAVGYTLSEDVLTTLTKLDDAEKREQNNLKALKNQIGAAFAPEITKLKEIEADLLADVTNFIKENPGLVKSIIAITAAIGGTYAIMKSYKFLKTSFNTLKAASALLTAKEAAASGADAAAKTGEAAATGTATTAQWRFNAALAANPIGAVLTAISLLTVGLIAYASEAKKETEELLKDSIELNKAVEEYKSTMSSLKDTYDESIGKAEVQSQRAQEYVDRLKELEAQGIETNEQQNEYANILGKLHALMPDLNIEIDKQTGLLKGGTAALEEQITKWKEKIKLQALENVATQAIQTQVQLTYDRDKAKKAYDEAEREADRLDKEAREKYGYGLDEMYFFSGTMGGDNDTTKPYKDAYLKRQELKKSLDEAEKALAENQDEVDALNQAYAEAAEAADIFTESENNVQGATEETGDAINDTTERLKALKDEYDNAYKAAYDSISGQYKLWDTAAVVVPQSIDEINTALETQTAYWFDYNKDLESLTKRSQYIEGLSDVIADFANGSKESVNVVAGLVNASDEELKTFVDNYSAMIEQEKADSRTLAEITSNNYEEMQDLLGEMETAIVEGMDLSEEARNAAVATIDAYADELSKRWATRGKMLFGENDYYQHFESWINPTGYASGTDSATPGAHLVGERGPELVEFRGGEKVYNAEETAAILDKGNSQTVITISPQFIIQGDSNAMSDNFDSYVAEIVAEVKEALEEAGVDAKRGAYA